MLSFFNKPVIKNRHNMNPMAYHTIISHYINPNTIKSYKILQKLSPKHAAHGVAQSTYPICRHGKACLSKQPPWRAAGDPRLAHGRSPVRAPGPAGTLRALFFSTLPPFLPPSGDSFFRTFPTNPAKVLGLIFTLLALQEACTNLSTCEIKAHTLFIVIKICCAQKLQLTWPYVIAMQTDQ